ncbi:hypothetical protein O3686_10775 [Streptococcus parasanguinis]|uniref:hypothetical protein n=1 Tax=Streptococcus parasanguinis TaxID=1318 RepID=UPI00352EC17E
MSLIDRFFEEYDSLMVKYGGVSQFYKILGDQRVSGYINRYLVDGHITQRWHDATTHAIKTIRELYG